MALLAEGGVPTGNYTQIRVTVDRVDVTYQENTESENITVETVEAEIPSDKLKFVRPFRVIDGGTTTIVLDFDLDKSVVFTGARKDGEVKVIVKPVVKLGITYGEDTTPPAQVTGLTVTTIGDTQLDLAWEANTALDLHHYNVYSSNSTGFTPNAFNRIA